MRAILRGKGFPGSEKGLDLAIALQITSIVYKRGGIDKVLQGVHYHCKKIQRVSELHSNMGGYIILSKMERIKGYV